MMPRYKKGGQIEVSLIDLSASEGENLVFSGKESILDKIRVIYIVNCCYSFFETANQGVWLKYEEVQFYLLPSLTGSSIILVSSQSLRIKFPSSPIPLHLTLLVFCALFLSFSSTTNPQVRVLPFSSLLFL